MLDLPSCPHEACWLGSLELAASSAKHGLFLESAGLNWLVYQFKPLEWLCTELHYVYIYMYIIMCVYIQVLQYTTIHK